MYKKHIAAVTSAACIMTMSSVAACASEGLSFVTKYNSDTGIVQLEGEGNGYIVVRVAPDDVMPNEFTVSNPPIVFDKIYADGDFVYECQLPADAPGGGYNIYLTDDSGTVSDSFRYFILEEANKIVNDDGGINDALKAGDYAAFETLLKQNAEKLGIDSEDELFAEKSDDIIKLMYDISETYSDSAELYNIYSLAYAVVDMEGADRAEIETILTKYEKQLGIDADSVYYKETRLSDNAKNTLCGLLADSTFAETFAKGESFAKVFANQKAVAAVKSAAKWQDISKAMTDTFEAEYKFVFDENDDYSKLSSLTSVYSEMMSDISEVMSLSDVQDKFDEAVKDVLPGKNSSGSGGGSSKGSGGGGGSVSIPNGQITPIVQTPAVSAQANPFSDITKDYWGYNAIVEMSAQKVVNGYEDGTFKPGNPITRAEFVKLIVSVAGIDTADAEFEDVPSDAWYAPYVGGAAKSGVVTGDGVRFNPDMPLTRQDTAVIVYRLLKNKGIDFDSVKNFGDAESVSEYALEAVKSLGGKGIINGTGAGNFEPLAGITRAEAAQLLFNAYEYLK